MCASMGNLQPFAHGLYRAEHMLMSIVATIQGVLGSYQNGCLKSQTRFLLDSSKKNLLHELRLALPPQPPPRIEPQADGAHAH